MKLDSKTIAALQLGTKSDQIFFDDQLPGFGYGCVVVLAARSTKAGSHNTDALAPAVS